MWLVTTAALAAAALGLALVWAGLRGRRTDDHPLCRRCGFDLTGRARSTNRCGERGADLTRRRAIRVGHRRRRRSLVVGGLLVGGLLVLLVAAGLGVRQSRWSQRWERHKPVWWLTAEVRHGGPPRAAAAMAELQRLLDAGVLPAADVPPVADALLDVQGDLGTAWNPAVGTLVGSLLPRAEPSRWQRYWRQAVVLQLRVRPAVRQGDPIPAELVLMSPRCRPDQSTGTPPLWVVVRLGAKSWEAWPRDEVQAFAFHVTVPVGSDGMTSLGRQAVTVRIHCRAGPGYADRRTDVEYDQTLSTETTIVTGDTVRPAGPAFAETLQRQLWFGGNPSDLVGHVYVLPRTDAPAAGSYQVAAVVRQGGRERPLGTFRSVKGGGWAPSRDVDLTGLGSSQMMPVVRCPAAMARDTVD